MGPARQAHHGHLVDAERVGDGPQIVGERQDGFVLMRRRGADAGPIDANQTNIVVLGVDPGFGRDLPPGPWGAMQPEDRTTLRGAELGEADPAVLADGDVSFNFGRAIATAMASSLACGGAAANRKVYQV